MSYSDDESLPGECDWCHDDRGLCDRCSHLDEDDALALSSRRPSMLKRYATTTSVFFVIKHDFNYFNVYFSSFTIRLAYPMPCKTLCLGEDGF